MRRRPTWTFQSPSPDLERELVRDLSIRPLTARVLAHRGVDSVDVGRQFLRAPLKTLTSPGDFADMQVAVDRIRRAIDLGEEILVFGDYDVDGLTGACLLYHFLKVLGARVDVYVPDRLNEGYGLSDVGLARALARKPGVLVTVDHGVTAYDAVAQLTAAGIDVIVTDHHQKPDRLPEAMALLNPLFLDDEHPASRLSGSGMAFKFACGIFEQLPQQTKDNRRVREVLREGLAFAALGTVADVVPLRGENRVVTRHGLKMLSESSIPGLQALLAAVDLPHSPPTAMDVSFSLAPRLNAAGRMGQVGHARELLMTDSPERARELAAAIEVLNKKRRGIEAKVTERALELAAERDPTEPVLVLADPSFHVGVIGISAARLAERTGRPAVLISVDGRSARGSARCPAGFDLARSFRAAGHTLLRHGGHAAAAGLEIDPARVDEFRQAICEHANEVQTEQRPAVLHIDAEVQLHQIDRRLVHELAVVAPFGEGNPDPVFAASGVELAGEPRRVGVDGNHLQLRFRAQGGQLRGIAFGLGDRIEDARAGKLEIAFVPRRSSYSGHPELLVKDLRTAVARSQAAAS